MIHYSYRMGEFGEAAREGNVRSREVLDLARKRAKTRMLKKNNHITEAERQKIIRETLRGK